MSGGTESDICPQIQLSYKIKDFKICCACKNRVGNTVHYWKYIKCINLFTNDLSSKYQGGGG